MFLRGFQILANIFKPSLFFSPGPTVTSVECLLITLILSEKPFFSTIFTAALAMGLNTCEQQECNKMVPLKPAFKTKMQYI